MAAEVNLTCSVNHVGDTAYTGFTYDKFAARLARLSRKYSFTPIVERDHLGKRGEDLQEWIERDIDNDITNFHLHIFEPSTEVDEILQQYDFCDFQIGPGEDNHRPIHDNLFATYCNHARSFSFPMGTMIQELSNFGAFDVKAVSQITQLYPRIRIRAHNCDYLTLPQLREVGACVDDINIAPQLGVIQSSFYLMYARTYGLPICDWFNACLSDKANQARWCGTNLLNVVPAVGHYHFDKLEWRHMCYDDTVDYIYLFLLKVKDATNHT